MIISEHPQLSEEWFAERAGLPTASNFSKIVTSKGLPSKSAKKYMYQLAIERVTGKKEDTYTSQAMERGSLLEEEARSGYSLVTGLSVETVGLCWKDDKKSVGASPDGLVDGSKGCLEIKCPSAAVHCEYLINNKVPTEYFVQVQGQMYVTGCAWSDFVSYYPGTRLLVLRMDRDEAFMSKLDFELKVFCAELDRLVEKIK